MWSMCNDVICVPGMERLISNLIFICCHYSNKKSTFDFLQNRVKTALHKQKVRRKEEKVEFAAEQAARVERITREETG